MKKQKPDHYWNYRIGTHYYKHPSNKEYNERLFSIIEVHYEKGKPVSYGGINILKDMLSLKSIKWTIKKIKECLKKPIFDLDNWPKKWNGKESKTSDINISSNIHYDSDIAKKIADEGSKILKESINTLKDNGINI
jgi:hypothetical protein